MKPYLFLVSGSSGGGGGGGWLLAGGVSTCVFGAGRLHVGIGLAGPLPLAS